MRFVGLVLGLAGLLLLATSVLNLQTGRRRASLNDALWEAVPIQEGRRVEHLLREEADANYRSGSVPVLKLACQDQGRSEVVRILLAYGADPNARDASGQNVLEVAAVYNKTSEVQMLLAAGADPSQRGTADMTALMWAVRNGNFIMVRDLLRCGADARLRDREGRSARDYARMWKDWKDAPELRSFRTWEERGTGFERIIRLLEEAERDGPRETMTRSRLQAFWFPHGIAAAKKADVR